MFSLEKVESSKSCLTKFCFLFGGSEFRDCFNGSFKTVYCNMPRLLQFLGLYLLIFPPGSNNKFTFEFCTI